MSEINKQELIRYVAGLKSENPSITWEEVAERVQGKFAKGGDVSLTPNAIRKRYNVWLKSEGSQKSENNKDQGERISMSQKAKDQLPQELLTFIEDYIEEYIRPVIERVSVEAAQRVFAEKFSLIQDIPAATSAGFPLAPPMPNTVPGTRRHTIQRGKLAGTVDSALLELFETERNERGCSVSRMLDIVIWNYFGIGRVAPPKLSFELSESHERDVE